MSKLIGTNPNQVPSNADLGTAAFTDSNDYISALSKINSNIAATAVDVFVYDTRKDSDGGAWRKRTQHTSWYNERLNTTTRGSRREFPAVAVFVAEAARVTIYDGDDINMPMWMQWNTTGALGWASGTSSVWITLTALNGIFAWGSDNRGLGFANFIKDKIEIIHGAQRYVLKDQSIALRETNVGTITSASDAEGGYSFPAQNDEIYDVAATVLPNAPIDPDSGLPRPTLAYAGPGGLNIITDSGKTVLITASAGSSYNGVSWVDFTKNHNLIFEQDNSSNPRSVYCIPVPTANRTTETNDGIITDKVIMKWYANGAHEPYPCFNGGGVVEAIGLAGDNQALRSEYGDLTILEPNLASPEYGKVAYISTYYNTGWMVGNIKLAALSDTTQETVVSTELVTNGTFDSNVSGFSGTMGSILSWDAGRAKSTAVATEIGISYSLSGLIVGKTYVASCDLDSRFGNSGSFFAWLKNENWSNNLGSAVIIDGVSVKVSTTFVATETSFVLSLVSSTGAISVGEYSYFDNFSVRIADADRSVNNKGLQVFGNITKTPVATGADLVAYSNFSSGNYFQQFYSSNLDFGTGDISAMGWFKVEYTYVGTKIFFDKANPSWPSTGSGQRVFFGLNGNDYLYYYTDNGLGTTSTAVPSNVWIHACFVRSGTSHQLYMNGKHVLTNIHTASSLSGSGNVLTVGNGSPSKANPWPGQLALWRLSATAPSPEQIAKIYNDEKVLFQDNAKATLYGTSYAVTALAYDDSTNLLHAGTSAGRSIFQGLRRIDNTTTAVGTAISASNGMVAEE
jgi:trimeric autotransporter adhesin